MSDIGDLPLFASLGSTDAPPAKCPPPAPSRRPKPRAAPASAAPAPVRPVQAPADRPAAQIVPFPLCRDVRLSRTLAAEFMKLRARHGGRARAMLIEARFKPLRARLRRLKVPTDVIRQELRCLEAEVAGLVWEADGRPGRDTGGGDAA